MAAWTDLLDERARHLLKVLIECHIRDGAPIGSRMLASESGLDISSTTVRAIMAELEELGLVASPHTSAGRIPTARGYRLFIDSLLTCDPPAQDEIERLRGLLSGDTSLQGLAVSVSALLSGVSSLAAVVMVPARERLILRHIELLRMNDEQVLAVMHGRFHRAAFHAGRVARRRQLSQRHFRRTRSGRDPVYPAEGTPRRAA
jgi:heat-inducible transcriptional repressor